MEYRIREYMDQLFESAPHTQRAYELKIELTQNLIEKYYAFIGEGKTPDDAYNLTIGSIGDVRELFSQLEDDENGDPVPPPVYYPQPRPDHRRALVRTAAVMLFILSPANSFRGAFWRQLLRRGPGAHRYVHDDSRGSRAFSLR